MQRRRIYLMRHAAVTYFRPGEPLRPDVVDLTDEGRAQAARVARELAGITFDRVVTSDLDRCQQTARAVLEGRDIQMETHAELREIAPGDVSGLDPGTIRETIEGAFRITDPTARFLGGETFGDFTKRVLGCLDRVIEAVDWDQMLIVAHGGVNRAILTRALGSGLAGFAHMEQDPCCVNVVDVDDTGRWIVRLLNHTPYNSHKDGTRATTMERLFDEFVAAWAE